MTHDPKEANPDFNLVFYEYRTYDPVTQRWLQRDPLGDPGFEVFEKLKSGNITQSIAELSEGPNLYALVGNEPINYFDDFGNGKYSARNANRSGHGRGGETKGGGRGDKHSRASGHGGRNGKSNLKKVDRRGKTIKCLGLFAFWLAAEEVYNEAGDDAPPIPDEGQCPDPYTPVRHELVFGFYYYTCDLLI